MEQDLVTIIIVTYNSEAWIIETLDSVKNQDYKNIELIISDDFSKDLTIKICKKWLEKNKNRFINTYLLKSDKNSGVVKNINKGLKKSNGNWIKLLGGDDLLTIDNISSNLKYSKKNNSEVVFSNMKKFKKINNENIYIKSKDRKNFFFKKSVEKQFKLLLKKNELDAPTSFFKKEILEKMNYFDETYPLVEDYPMWLKLSENKIKLDYFNEVTILYRVHENSLSNNEKKIINLKMYSFRKELYKNYLRKKIKNPLYHYSEYLMYIRNDSIIKEGNNKRTLIAYLTYFIDPFSYLKILDKLKNKLGEVY